MFFSKKDKEPQNIKEILAEFSKLEKKVEGLKHELRNMKEKGKMSIQKVGIVRFNPFSRVGGDQSFSAALLDDKNNGVVITSLFTQDGNRVYGKPIENGQSKYELSKEEKEAISKAVSFENPKSEINSNI